MNELKECLQLLRDLHRNQDLEPPPPTAYLLVGYRTKLKPDWDALLPAIVPDKRLSDPAKIELDLENKKEAWRQVARELPHTAEFEQVCLSDPLNNRKGWWTDQDRGPAGSKQPLCLAVRSWLMKYYPKAWPDHLQTNRAKQAAVLPGKASGIPAVKGKSARPQEVIFIGFDCRTFLKILGTECSLPEHNNPMPLAFWYGNSSHRDIAEAAAPSENSKSLELRQVLMQRRRPKEAVAAALWDKLLSDWVGPHQDPERDTQIAYTLALQLGFLPEPPPVTSQPLDG